MPSNRKPRTERELMIAAAHVGTELVTMTREGTRAVITGSNAPDEYERAASIEAALIHLRALCEFLVGRGPSKEPTGRPRRWNPRDISPLDFVEGWDPPETPATRALTEILPLLDQRLAHLSWRRVEEPQFSFSIEILDHCIRSYQEFLNHAVAGGGTKSTTNFVRALGAAHRVRRGP